MTAATYSFCEPVSATPTSRVHIRRVGAEGIKTGGGVTGAPLCGYDLHGGWDVPGPVTTPVVVAGIGAEVAPTCPDCAALWVALL